MVYGQETSFFPLSTETWEALHSYNYCGCQPINEMDKDAKCCAQPF